MKRIVLILSIFALIQAGYGQTYDREWATYFGDSSLWISGMTELNGDLYLVGKTTSSDHTESLTSTSSYQAAYGGGETDGFIARFSQEGELVWFTYYGGIGTDAILDIITDETKLYIVGKTQSSGMATSGVHQTNLNGNDDGFIASFNEDGTRNWHTYFGGEGEDDVISLTRDEETLYIYGRTTSHTSIATAGSFQDTISPDGDGGNYINNFIGSFTNNGIRLWATYYGIPSDLNGTPFNNHLPLTGIAVNKTGVYLSGWDTTANNTYYGTLGAFMEMKPSGIPLSLYLSKFSYQGNRLWSTYFSAFSTSGNTVGITPFGGAGPIRSYHSISSTLYGVYLSGRTLGTVGIGTAGAFQPTKTGGSVPFIQHFNNVGERIWGSYLGNGGSTQSGGGYAGSHLNGLSIDTENSIYIAGATHSVTDIATDDAFQLERTNYTDCFVAKVTPDGTSKIYGTYYGGENNDNDGQAVPIGNGDSLYLVGTTSSTSNMTTEGAWQEDFIYGGTEEKNIFIVKFTDEELLKTSKLAEKGFVLYPNPATDSFYIKSDFFSSFDISITNIIGQKMLQKSVTHNLDKVDIGSLSKGIYFVSIKDENQQTLKTVKLIKK